VIEPLIKIQVRLLISILLIMITYSYGSGQKLCSGPLNVTVEGSLTGVPMTVNHYSYDIFCLGLDEGAIELIVEGGSPEFSSVWNTGETTEELVNLSAGTYSVTITDGNNCKDTLTIDIEEIHPLANDMFLMDEDGCGICSLSDSIASYFYSDIDYMLYVEDLPDGIDLGQLEVCTKLSSETLYIDENPALRRSWCMDGQGGLATVRLFFTDEEFKVLMEDASVPYIKSANLIVQAYNGGSGTPDDFDLQLTVGDISLALFDNIENVWSVEFTIDLPPGNTCFYIEYIRDESQKTVDELTSFIEAADFRIIQNPVTTHVQLDINHLSCVLSGNIYIEDEIQQLVYKSTFVDTYLGIQTIDVIDYAAGMYFLTIEFPKAKISKTFKFIKVSH